jgi:cathepsin F
VAVSLANQRPTLKLAEVEFQRWMNMHGRFYATPEEYSLRFSNYLNSVQRIQQRNAKSAKIGGAYYAVNKYSDLSSEEFAKQYLTARPSSVPMDKRQVLPKSNIIVADTFDWRNSSKVTDVKDQGQCGSCWAFSVTENIESVWMIKHDLNPKTMEALAPQQIVDCDTTDSGCNGGDTPTAYEYVISAGGMDTEASYPYQANDGTCQFNAHDVYASISSYKYATKTKNEVEIKTNLVAWAPLSICVDAEPWQDYSSGVMKHAECGDDLDHCVQLTGYADAVWNVRNSWGADWGESGFIRLEMGYNTCGMADEATTAVV